MYDLNLITLRKEAFLKEVDAYRRAVIDAGLPSFVQSAGHTAAHFVGLWEGAPGAPRLNADGRGGLLLSWWKQPDGRGNPCLMVVAEDGLMHLVLSPNTQGVIYIPNVPLSCKAQALPVALEALLARL